VPFSSMAAWTKLAYFYIGQNQFSGRLPTDIGAFWPDMVNADISNNNFTGTLPASIGNWRKLAIFRCDKNRLTGTIPATVKNWSSSPYSFLFHGNSFIGPVPRFGTTVNGKEFCPKNGTGYLLSADCKSEITCVCCSSCCDNNGDFCTAT
jgi:hypothetical protein